MLHKLTLRIYAIGIRTVLKYTNLSKNKTEAEFIFKSQGFI